MCVGAPLIASQCPVCADGPACARVCGWLLFLLRPPPHPPLPTLRPSDDVYGPLGGIPTVGGVYVDVIGRFLGLDPSVLSASFSGGIVKDGVAFPRTYTVTSCIVAVRALGRLVWGRVTGGRMLGYVCSRGEGCGMQWAWRGWKGGVYAVGVAVCVWCGGTAQGLVGGHGHSVCGFV